MTAVAGVEPPQDPADDGALRTVDELASAAGLTVRTTRYYASLGLLPPPARRGRMAWYDDTHLARLEMIRALQGHGFTLQAIEKYLASLPNDASIEDLAVQRAMLTSWTVGGPQDLTRRQLDQHAGRRLTDEEVALIEELGMLRRSEDERGTVQFTPVHGFDVAVSLIELDIPVSGMRAAGEAIARHMSALAHELTEVLHDEVLEPWRHEQHGSRDKAEHLESTLAKLRRLTLDAIVAAFQRSANDVIARSLQRR
ncbi:MerR family transcriptional regulator [Nocardioides sp. SYSU DS0651]|uniref:MerR family transcriptional regulator n=1 Tax=Nocardioides sp. SYSU DS0651 TaxID=3415955 RepID=UPI003F4C6786